MSDWYMLTLVGRDQAGIVAEISQGLFDAGFKLGETSMMRLGGNFTMMLMVSCVDAKDENRAEQDDVYLTQQLQTRINKLDLCSHIDPIIAHLHEHIIPNLRVSVYGADRSGIVAKVTKILQQQEFNILDLESDVGGTNDKPIYIMHIEGHADIEPDALERALIEADTAMDVKVNSVDTLLA